MRAKNVAAAGFILAILARSPEVRAAVCTPGGQPCPPPGSAKPGFPKTVNGPSPKGELILFPPDVSRPNTSSISFNALQTRANNALVYPSATTATFSVFNSSASSLDFVLDVKGYFQ